jgi:hypothetical protein
MFVPSLMMKPEFGVALDRLLLCDRRFVSLKILYGRPEFGKGVFGQVMFQTLGIQSALKTHLHHKETVSIDGIQMSEETPEEIHTSKL